MQLRVGDVLADANTLIRDTERFRPVVAEDEEGHSRLYLPTQQFFGLVVLLAEDLVWMAPLLLAANFAEGTFDALWNLAHDEDVDWLFPLDAIPGHLTERSIAGLHLPTPASEELLEAETAHVVYALPGPEIDSLRAKLQRSILRAG